MELFTERVQHRYLLVLCVVDIAGLLAEAQFIFYKDHKLSKFPLWVLPEVKSFLYEYSQDFVSSCRSQ